jgi:hypothetical protein
MLRYRYTTCPTTCSIYGPRHGLCMVHLRFAGSTIDNSIRGGHRGYFMSWGHDAPAGSFCRFWLILGSPFCLFYGVFNSGRRYTRKRMSTLCSSPSETSTQAPQLGPGGYRVVQSVDLGFEAVPALLKWLTEPQRVRFCPQSPEV